MDCERFDKGSLELLYDELDELSASALRRHLSHCSRCQALWTKASRTRELSRISLEDAPEGLFDDIMKAEREVERHLSVSERAGRVISVLAGYAMRPQVAMAALLLLMIGSSLVFVRTGPGQGDQVAVREAGEPEVLKSSPNGDNAGPIVAPSDIERSSSRNASAPPQSKRAEEPALERRAKITEVDELRPSYQDAMAAYQAGRYAEAERLFSEVSALGGEKAGAAALHEAHAARNGSGCQRAASFYDQVARAYAGSSVADEAAWQAANCYRALGQPERARAHLRLLTSRSAYAEQANKVLGSLDAPEHTLAEAGATKSPAKAAAPAASSAPTATEPSAPSPEDRVEVDSAPGKESQ